METLQMSMRDPVGRMRMVTMHLHKIDKIATSERKVKKIQIHVFKELNSFQAGRTYEMKSTYRHIVA